MNSPSCFQAGADAEARKQTQKMNQKIAFKKQLDDQILEADARKRAEKVEKEAENQKVLKDVKSYIQVIVLHAHLSQDKIEITCMQA
jgi:hypothetical protein